MFLMMLMLMMMMMMMMMKMVQKLHGRVEMTDEEKRHLHFQDIEGGKTSGGFLLV